MFLSEVINPFPRKIDCLVTLAHFHHQLLQVCDEGLRDQLLAQHIELKTVGLLVSDMEQLQSWAAVLFLLARRGVGTTNHCDHLLILLCETLLLSPVVLNVDSGRVRAEVRMRVVPAHDL